MQEKVDSGFKARVNNIVSQIPKGHVMTYGQIAALCGNPRAARIVGGIAHFGDPNLPWQRVVMKDGGLARGFPGGLSGHKSALESEGIVVSKNFKIDVQSLAWQPNS